MTTVAQTVDGDLSVHRSRHTGLATFVTARDGGRISLPTRTRSPAVRPADFLHSYGPLFGVTDPANELAVSRSDTDALGHRHTIYQQLHNGIEVFSGMLKVHQDSNTEVYAANGDFYPISNKLNTTPTLSAEEAADAAIQHAEQGEPEVEQTRLVIVDPGWYGDVAIGEHLAYYVVLTDWSVPLHDAFFVDAHTGDVLDRWGLSHSAKYRVVYDGQGTTYLPGVLERWEGQPPRLWYEVNSAYDFMGDTYDLLYRGFGRDSIDDAGLHLVATVNSQALTCPNAEWRTGALQSVYCPGLTVDDVVGHELGHGLTTFTSNLIYQNQSGQLNESYSDIFGEAVDLFNGDASEPGLPAGTSWPKDSGYQDNGTDTPNSRRFTCSGYDSSVRWLIGEDWVVIRDMWDPTCKGHPDRANSPLQTCSAADWGGVHSGSGIPNHAFAMMTDGKSFNGYLVNGIGLIKSLAVWYRAMTTYLTPSSDFTDAYIALNQAASDLIGTYANDPRTGLPYPSTFTAEDAAEVDKALLAVEMNTDGLCGATNLFFDPDPPEQCSNRTTVYTSDFENGPNGWYSFVTIGNPPTPSPWQWTTDLPAFREGFAWFCSDPDIGDCGSQDESAVHSLYSPVIALPPAAADLRLIFAHYVATETGWDGGNLRVSTDGGGWELVPTSTFRHNPYNALLSTASHGNTNPLAGQPAFTGVGGEWGISLVDLSALAAGAQTIQLRFDFGKDGCTGLDGWYVDDVELYYCLNCPDGPISWLAPLDGVIDARQPRDATTAELQGIDLIVTQAPMGADPSCWALCETDSEEAPNTIEGVTEYALGVYSIQLARGLTPGAVTKITYQGNTASATGSFTSLPADSNADGLSNTSDILSLIDCCLNEVCTPPYDKYSCDIDRSDVVNTADILRLIDLLNGAGAFLRGWNLESPYDGGECP
ncbi:MAG: M4 family metallopeptidase [Phycisphaerales bacterium]|nr:MAG: M4 family metallopeptidase [Phycisphaerales bacterium]